MNTETFKEGFKAANLALRFLLELCLLAALAAWGSQVGSSTVVQILVGLGAPLTAIVVWGLFVAPQAPRRPEMVPWLLIQIVLFGAGVAGLIAADHAVLAALLGIAFAANTAILFALGALEPEPAQVKGLDPRD